MGLLAGAVLHTLAAACPDCELALPKGDTGELLRKNLPEQVQDSVLRVCSHLPDSRHHQRIPRKACRLYER